MAQLDLKLALAIVQTWKGNSSVEVLNHSESFNIQSSIFPRTINHYQVGAHDSVIDKILQATSSRFVTPKTLKMRTCMYFASNTF